MKEHPGSFTGTDLQETLEKTGAKKVVLCGYMVRLVVHPVRSPEQTVDFEIGSRLCFNDGTTSS